MLKEYALMAAGFLATAKTIAGVVYTDVDPDHYLSDDDALYGSPPASFDIDFDGDGNPEFILEHDHVQFGWTPGTFTNEVRLVGMHSNARAVAGSSYTAWGYPVGFAAALSYGALVGASEQFFPSNSVLLGFYADTYSWYNFVGTWATKTDHYLGVQFELADGLHYGWLRLDVGFNYGHANVKDFAYESEPDVAIVAGYTGNCPAPDGLAASPLAGGSASLTWNENAAAEKYQLKGQRIGVSGFLARNAATGGKVVNGLVPGAAYQWTVRARCYDGTASNFAPADTFLFPLATEAATKKSAISTEGSTMVYASSREISISGQHPIFELELFDFSGRLIKHMKLEEPVDVLKVALPYSGMFIYTLHSKHRE